eukprot:1822787-Amphidinium_carterae.1
MAPCFSRLKGPKVTKEASTALHKRYPFLTLAGNFLFPHGVELVHTSLLVFVQYSTANFEASCYNAKGLFGLAAHTAFCLEVAQRTLTPASSHPGTTS